MRKFTLMFLLILGCSQSMPMGLDKEDVKESCPLTMISHQKINHTFSCVVVQCRGVEYVYIHANSNSPPVLVCSHLVE